MLSLLTKLSIAAIVALQSLGIANAETERAGRHWRNSDFPELEGYSYASAFHTYANVRLTPERRLSNGVSWRLFIDTRTTTAMPRITWMPWRESMKAANRFLETMHGVAIEDVRKLIATWQEIASGEPVKRSPPPLNIVFQQGPVALTYASQRFVGLLEQGSMQYDERAASNWNRGLVFDIDTGKVFAAESCKGKLSDHRYGRRKNAEEWQPPYEGRSDFPGFFTYGDLMQVCDGGSYTAFRALVVRWAAKTVEADKARTANAECGRWARLLLSEDWPMLMVLTTSGLALHARGYRDNRLPCAGGHGTPDPVIVPYRELAPFFRPGPLRDELLK